MMNLPHTSFYLLIDRPEFRGDAPVDDNVADREIPYGMSR